MNTAVLHFAPSGTTFCLYTELIELATIGRLEITRATNIEFNNINQSWQVTNPNGRMLFFSQSRNACLEWEQQNL